MKSNLLALEDMTGTERIMEALEIRGFFVEKEGDFIVLKEGNGREDLFNLRNLLHDLNIPTFWVGNSVQILIENVPVVIMKKIMNHHGREFPIYINSYQKRWKYFVQREFGPKSNTLALDPHIAMLVKSLNIAGVMTLSGCDGHRRYAPHFRLMGPFVGIWFEIIRGRYLNHLQLYYKWNVEFDNQTGAVLIAGKPQDERWNLSIIRQDTVKMAAVIQKNAEEIRALKRLFSRKVHKKQAHELAEKKKWEDLKEWMKGLLTTSPIHTKAMPSTHVRNELFTF